MTGDNGKLVIEQMVVGYVETNCYAIHLREDTGEAVVVDPGDDGKRIAAALRKKGLRVSAILLTHGHFDHIGGVKELVSEFQEDKPVPVYAYAGEKEIIRSTKLNLSDDFGVPVVLEDVVYLEDGAEIEAAGCRCRLIATPGHTAGSCCYYFEEDGVLLSGDTLFQYSVGRTDFPTGSMSVLVRSIRDRLLVLPDSVRCYPGHGDMTTIGQERAGNPFITA